MSTGDVALKIGDGVSNYSELAILNVTSLEKPVYNYTEILGLSNKLTEIENKINLIPIIPTGMIMIWSGLQSNIPDGWVLCDGNNGTPDLTDKFILGAGNSYSVGDIGGEETHILTTDEMPVHSHSLSNNSIINSTTNGNVNIVTGGYFITTSKFETINVTNTAGNGDAHNNMPPYYALCYIMKI